MSEELQLVRLLHGNVKHLKLSGKKLQHVPRPVCRMQTLAVLEMKNNKLSTFPDFLSSLTNLEFLNLGNNELEEMPCVIQHMEKLIKLHLFGNKICRINHTILSKLKNLVFLNINKNQLTSLPPEISQLNSLQILSMDWNQLQYFPVEICSLVSLVELRASHNQLQALPLEIGLMTNLNRVFLAQNKIKELPEGFGRLRQLHILDVAGNELRIFPTETHNIPLRELYCEANPLLDKIPVHSVQEEEILSLKELAARLVMKEVKIKKNMILELRSSNDTLPNNYFPRGSAIRHMIRYFPGVREMLSQASRCAVCSEAFLNTWLECVKFVKAGKELKIGKCNNAVIPVRALLCSYKCFNSEGHAFYGVAFP